MVVTSSCFAASTAISRPSNRRHSDTFREHVLALVREHYADFGPTLAAEHLAESGFKGDRFGSLVPRGQPSLAMTVPRRFQIGLAPIDRDLNRQAMALVGPAEEAARILEIAPDRKAVGNLHWLKASQQAQSIIHSKNRQ